MNKVTFALEYSTPAPQWVRDGLQSMHKMEIRNASKLTSNTSSYNFSLAKPNVQDVHPDERPVHIDWPRPSNTYVKIRPSLVQIMACRLFIFITSMNIFAMMTSSNENIFRVTCPLPGEFTGEFPPKGQWRGGSIFSLICTWTNDWVNNRDTGDLGPLWRHCNEQFYLACAIEATTLHCAFVDIKTHSSGIS